jgi:putative N-acetylmannosamine-6-phosphate epimerase
LTVKRDRGELISELAGKLIVSCQDYTSVMIDAAIRGGASGLRINSPRDVRLARRKTDIPVIGCNKIYFPNSPIYITPSVRAALALVEAGADIVALDCTNRRRVRQPPGEIVAAIHEAGALALADLAGIEEAADAVSAGADILATTLAPTFDVEFIRGLARLDRPVLAEGHIDTPERAKAAVDAGAWAICVGTAITRPHLITAQFNRAIGG